MSRLKAHQVIPAIVIAVATAVPAAATVQFLNQAPSAAVVAGNTVPLSPSTPVGGGSAGKGNPPTGSGTRLSIHVKGGGDDGGSDDGATSRRRSNTVRPIAKHSQPSSGGSTGAGGQGSAGTGGAVNGSFTGQAVNDPFGTVQTTITVSGGKITNVVTSAPNSGYSGSINQQAVPMLKTETLQAQSASINTISGATYTSQAFIQSLQSAMTQAHI